MVLNAAVQALKKAEPLKDRVQHCKNLLNDTDAWICQQQLQKIYQQVLILDLEYALDKKVEQELWNLGFKNYIVMLQNEAKNRNNPNRSEFQGMLSWCLELASGFYLSLLQEICEAFDLDLPFRRKSYIYGLLNESSSHKSEDKSKKCKQMSNCHKSSCFYMCQYCLVHLGDIARYRNENKQAELFYRHAVSLAPSSGQPYNQLALLEASRGDKLGTVFHYTRSVAVKHPFPVAKTNLEKTLLSTSNETDSRTLFNQNKSKFNAQEYVNIFLKFHGAIYNNESKGIEDERMENSLKEYVKLLTDSNLTALVATESFTSWKLVQMLVINLYALYQSTGSNLSSIESFNSQQKISSKYLLDLIGGSFSALLLPVYTFKNNIIDYFALPAIKLYLDWLTTQKSAILEDKAFVSRPQIWPSLCTLLNLLQDCINDTDYKFYNKIPLPEDRDLQGFLPLEKTFENFKFCDIYTSNKLDFKKLRAVRILNLGTSLTEYQVNGMNLINISTSENHSGDGINKVKKFTCATEGLSNELIKQLEELKLQKTILKQEVHQPEKKISGILKPQPDATLSTSSSSSSSSSSVKSYRLLPPEPQAAAHLHPQPPAPRKIRQNIAMQAIIKQVETEQKQVTFSNVSPTVANPPKVNNIDNVELNQVQPSLNVDFHNIIPNGGSNFSPPPLNQVKIPMNNLNQHQHHHSDPFVPSANTQSNWSPQLINYKSPLDIYRDTSPKAYLSSQNDEQLLIQNANLSLVNDYCNLIQHDGIKNEHPGMSAVDLKNFNGIISNPIQHQQQQPQLISNPLSVNHYPLSAINSTAYESSNNFNMWKDSNLHEIPSSNTTWWDSINWSASTTQNTTPIINNSSSLLADDYLTVDKNPSMKNTYEQNKVHDVQSIQPSSNVGSNIYSLFSGNIWGSTIDNNLTNENQLKVFQQQQQQQSQQNHQQQQQSLWAGPGPSPLERLLEQQKSLREGGT